MSLERNAPDNSNDHYINYEKVEMLGAEIGAVWTPLEDLMIKASYMISNSVNNLFDKDYGPNSGYPAHGRQIWLGVTCKY
jgi:outer membrane cobalamin receptor